MTLIRDALDERDWQRDAALALHVPGWESTASGLVLSAPLCAEDGESYPCPTARALGVTEPTAPVSGLSGTDSAETGVSE